MSMLRSPFRRIVEKDMNKRDVIEVFSDYI